MLSRPSKISLLRRIDCLLAVIMSVTLLAMTLVPTKAGADEVSSKYHVSSYVLHANDQLSITVLNHDDYTKSVIILSDGTFDYPIIGVVPAAGKTVKQLTEYMEHGLSSELNEPQVTISVTNYYAPQVSVVGAVSKPGSIAYIADWRILDVLAAAGGLNAAPGAVTMTVVRPGSDPIDVNAVALMHGDDPSINIPILPGDTVLVEQRDINDLTVQVTGQVKQPGAFPVPPGGESPLTAILAAGGATDAGDLRNVRLLHNGQVTVFDISDATDTLQPTTSIPNVLPGDSLEVPQNKERIEVLGSVVNQHEYYLALGQVIKTSDAISEAGGPSPNADLAKITVLRYVGTTPKVYKVDLAKVFRGGDSRDDLPLQPGDVVYVPAKGQSPNDGVFLYPLLAIAQLMRL